MATKEASDEDAARRHGGQGLGAMDSITSSVYASTVLSLENEEANQSYKLNDQQWILQRKKIGLSRRTKLSMAKVKDVQEVKHKVLHFITQNFARRECCRFVPDPTRKFRPKAASPGPKYDGPCFCGAPEDEHKSRAAHIKATAFEPSKFETINEDEEPDDGDTLSTTSSTTNILGNQRMARNRKNSSPPVSIVSGLSDVWNTVNAQRRSTNSKVEPKQDSRKSEVSLDLEKESKKKDRFPSVEIKMTPHRRHHEPTPTTNPSVGKEGVWNAERDVQEFPTNAFGQIEFVNEDEGSLKPSKYIRLSDKTPMELVKELLIDHWKLFQPHRPHLALSLIGGAKNFKMEGRKKETFKTGLISAAKSTNALILTGGTNTGTMKLVGDAVREGQFLVQSGEKLTRGLKLLGLCSWGYIRDKEFFVNPDPKEFNKVKYNSNVEIQHGENVPLNGDHTHFLMIDDGSRYRFFSAHTDFITRFETMVRDPEPKGLGIPIVTLLLEGGKDAIRIVKDRLREGIACVVIEGSGRAADIISYAYKNAVKNPETKSYTLKEGHIAHLMKLLDKEYGTFMSPESYKQEQLQNLMNWTIECIRYSDIITIFDIRRETHLDKKILSALLKTDKMNLHHQLYLAMVWDRVDLVEEKVLVKDTLNTMESLNDLMMQALLMERIKFIELLVMNGFVMRKFLTVERLRTLYNDACIRFKELPLQLKMMIGYNGTNIHLRIIHKQLVHFLKDHSHNLYYRDMPLKGKYLKKQLVDLSERLFEEPYVELFLWAILTNKASLIDFFWKKCKQPILMSIVAAAIYSKLSFFYKSQNKSIKILQKRKTLFQERANSLIEIAYQSDQAKALSLLEKRNKRWGGRNLMQLSYIGHLRTFIANPTCQTVVHSSWKRGFARLPWYSCVLCLFMPFLIWTPMVKFVRGLGDDGGDLTAIQKLYVFYRAPIIKYTGTCFSFMILIGLYSYVALFGFRFYYQVAEIVLYFWILTLIFDEIREILMEPSNTLRGKISDYLDSVWNRFDLVMFGTTIISFILKHFEKTFMLARITFACNAAFFYMRVFRIYHASRSLGPKLVIFHRMIPEIVTFMFLLLIFILGYGVASQSMIDPYRVFKWDDLGPLLFDIVFLPYWQMYGELSLDEIKVKETDVCPNEHQWEPFKIGNPEGHCYPGNLENIKDYDYVIPMLLAIYLLIGNVMLLNLLIAIFTSVFEEVHENSNEVWKWEMYRLVEEYDKKPGLAPPLVIFEDIFKLIKGIWKVTCRKKKENLELYMQETLNTLKLFERDCLFAFNQAESLKTQLSVETRISKLEEKTDQLLELFEEAPDTEANWGETIDMDKKFFESSEDSDSEKDEVDKLIQRRNTQKSKKYQSVKEEDPKTVRLKTARSSRMYRQFQAEVVDVKEQLMNLKEQRQLDMEKMERNHADLEIRIEKTIQKAIKKTLAER